MKRESIGVAFFTSMFLAVIDGMIGTKLFPKDQRIKMCRPFLKMGFSFSLSVMFNS